MPPRFSLNIDLALSVNAPLKDYCCTYNECFGTKKEISQNVLPKPKQRENFIHIC
jgi:hypothetical protein